MRLKVYQAPNMGAAMALVRNELGAEAVILATSASDSGVEITAGVEAPASPLPAAPDPATESALRWHGTPAPLAAKLARHDLATAIQSEFAFSDLPCGPDDAPLLFVGPPGAGKTFTVARLITRLVLAGQRPYVITADGKRAGAAEQLAAFTRLLGLTLIAVDEPLPLARALARRPDCAPVIIDTPGIDPANPTDAALLRDLASTAQGALALVLPSGLDPADAQELAEGFHRLGTTLLVATRLDLSRRLGGILAAASAGLALTEAGIGAGVADGLRQLSPEFLSERLIAAAPGRHQTPPPAKPVSHAPLSLAALARPCLDPHGTAP